jgi:hypothetical protein
MMNQPMQPPSLECFSDDYPELDRAQRFIVWSRESKRSLYDCDTFETYAEAIEEALGAARAEARRGTLVIDRWTGDRFIFDVC